MGASCSRNRRRSALETPSWYFPNISRRDAERLLEYLDNEPGVFLVRDSEQEKGNGWSLSVLHETTDRKERQTKHYKIRQTEHGSFKIISEGNEEIFQSLNELIRYYSENANGLCRRLEKPCPKEESFLLNLSDLEESRENIKLNEVIGRGKFGVVYKGLWRKKHIVAVKTVIFNNSNENSINEFKRELEINKNLKNKTIVRLWCVCTIGEPIYLVTEYMANGSLLEYLKRDFQNRLGFKEIVDMATQIAEGMKYLESIKCVHRDLAARNILVGEKNTVKIADFGLAQMLDKNTKAIELPNDINFKFPIRWSAPEVFSADAATLKRQYTIKSDVWSFGILLYELITKGGEPYSGMTNIEVITRVKLQNYRLPQPNGLCNDNYYSIMITCWHENPESRPTFEALFNTFNDYYTSFERPYTSMD